MAEEKVAEEQKIAAEEKALAEERAAEERAKAKPEGFIASVTDTSIKIMNVDEDEEARIIKQYYQREQKEVEENIKKK